ncbi:MAG: glycosyltransferase, partial [Cyclobacteriaceae bacterium]
SKGDNFSHSLPNSVELRLFAELLDSFKPDIVHVHHFVYLGIEIFAILRKCLPEARILFTMHDFMAICHHGGSMIKTQEGKQCHRESPIECSICFPQRDRADFFLRKSFIKDHLSKVDLFVASSQFLAKRYEQWGLDQNKIRVMENYLAPVERIPPRQLLDGEKRTKFAYFGQLNKLKGIHIILEALNYLPQNLRNEVSVVIYGSNLDKQTKDFQKKIRHQIESTSGVHFGDSYETEDLPVLMAECDWVIVPSLWWENSPLVIQEAIAFGRPLIGSNIGGTKEKIEDIAGLTFLAGNPISLASKMTEAIQPSCFDYWIENLPTGRNILGEYYDLYDEMTLSQKKKSPIKSPLSN